MAVGVQHRVEYALFRLLEGTVGSLGWDRRVALGEKLGRVWHAVDRRHREIARDNVRRAYPEWDEQRVRHLVRANFRHLGRTAAEFVGLGAVDRDELLGRFRLEGEDILRGFLDEGQGVFLLGAHLGNWEVSGAALAARGVPIEAIGRRMKNPLVDARITAHRQRFGATVIPHRQAVRPVFRALRAGAPVGFLMDQRAMAGEGVLSEYFGRPVSTNKGLALLALKSRAPVLPAFTRREEGAHVLRIGSPLVLPEGGTQDERVVAFTREIDRVTEAAVRKHPEQWFWVHRRWRVPKELLG